MMRSGKIISKSISAVLCAAMLFNPILTAKATDHPTFPPRSPEITEEYLKDKIPMYFYVGLKTGEATDIESNETYDTFECYYGLKVNVSVSVWEIDKAEPEEVENIDLGDQDTGREYSVIAGLPMEIREKYSDRSKYNVNIIIRPIDLPEDIVLYQEGSPYAVEECVYEYNNENEFLGDIALRKKIIHTQTGVLHLKAPEKREYNIGEEFDVTGGEISGFGDVRDKDKGIILNWDNFGRELILDDLDISEFDNTKPGEYHISVKPVCFDNTIYDKLEDKIVYDGFYVTVAGDGNDTNSEKSSEPGPSDETQSEHKFNLTFHKVNNSDYDDDRVKNAEDWNNVKFSLKADIYEYKENSSEKTYEIDLGTFDTKDTNSVTLKVSDEVYKKYDDTEKYSIKLTVIPLDMPENKVLSSKDNMDRDGKTYFELSEYDEDFDIYLRDKVNVVKTGSVSLQAPDKRLYTIGEELDLTGGIISGSGVISADNQPAGANWDIFMRELRLEDLDLSEFDNTKPGYYTIKPKKVALPYISGDETNDMINYGSFDVKVEGEPAVENKTKVSELKGDANLDEEISLADAVAIMQFISNPDKHDLSEQAKKNSDVTGDNDGVTSKDALVIQKYKLNMIDSFE